MVLDFACQNTHLEVAHPQQTVPNAAAPLHCPPALSLPEGQPWGSASSRSYHHSPTDLQELSLFLKLLQIWLKLASGFRSYQRSLTLQSHILDFLRKKPE